MTPFERLLLCHSGLSLVLFPNPTRSAFFCNTAKSYAALHEAASQAICDMPDKTLWCRTECVLIWHGSEKRFQPGLEKFCCAPLFLERHSIWLCRLIHNTLTKKLSCGGTKRIGLNDMAAVAHSVLVIVYHVLTKGEPYQDLGPDYFRQQNKEQQARRFVHQ
jgi:hypothetical protein